MNVFSGLAPMIHSRRRCLSVIIFISAVVLCAVVCRAWMNTLRATNYEIFNLNETISWKQNQHGYFRGAVKGHIDNILPSKDRWRSFDVSFTIKNLRGAAVITHYYDPGEFSFISFNQKENLAVLAHIANGKSEVLKYGGALIHEDQNVCRLKVTPQRIEFFINGKMVCDGPGRGKPARFGFLSEYPGIPRTLFDDIEIKGVLEDGLPISARVLYGGTFRLDRFFFLVSFGLLCALAFAVWSLVWCVSAWFAQDGPTDNDQPFHIRPGAAALIHLVVAGALFWRFLFRGGVLISSYDNIGEILPLFFYSKHVFLDWLGGVSSGLWCSLAHNGMPFYTSHWNMAFYPFHWPIFFAPDAQVLHWLTLKTFIEVFLIGVFAFGFFRRELDDDLWALVCAVSYQTGSLLIFTLNIFPTVSLFFAMTVYLYLVWSLSQRRWLWNYIWITFTVYLILTSANVAFVFYTVCSLTILTVYRFWNCHRGQKAAAGTLISGIVTGFLIGAIRLLPCLWGILNSNRLVADYFSIHDRFPLIVRFFVPSIAGWLGPDQHSILSSPRLGWIFDNINPQSGFFVYYGILMALLVMVSLGIPARGKMGFWKWYGWLAIACALLWKPVWGIISILFFPLNHFSYHTIILPVAICGLAGHAGCAITNGKVKFPQLKKAFLWVMIFFGSYTLIFLTYLFPEITFYSRVFVAAAIVLGCIWAYLKQTDPHVKTRLAHVLIAAWFILITGIWLSFGSVLIVKENFTALWLGEYVLWPLVFILTGFALAGYAFSFLTWPLSGQALRRALVWVSVWIAGTLIMIKICFSGLSALAGAPDGLRIYIGDVITDHMKWLLLTFLFAGLAVFLFQKKLPRRLLAVLIVALVLADMVSFNMRFENIAAPFGFRNAFYSKYFRYEDIPDHLRKKLDLVQYRVGHQERVGLNANKNIIFDIPSYSGTMGYMPKRFAEFIHAFGQPADTILIYPVDAIQNDRFLDLSSVRYIFTEKGEVSERITALPRMSLFYQHDVVSNKDVLLAALVDQRFDYHNNVLLSSAPEDPLVVDYFLRPDPVQITFSRSGEVQAAVEAKYPGVILFNESFDEGWQAYVDGNPVPVLQANYNFMACTVSQGAHEVRFLYRPRKYTIAKAIHYAGLALFIMILGFAFFFKRSKIKKAA